MRFFIVGGLIWKFGAPIKALIDKYFNTLATLFTILLIGITTLVFGVLGDDEESKDAAPAKVEQSIESAESTAESTSETITTTESCDTLD